MKNTSTYKYECPEGDVFVKVADVDGKLWVDASVGYAGSPILADAFAICALSGIAIRHGTPPQKIINALKGITHEGSNGFRLYAQNSDDCALSIADAIGRALERTLLHTVQ